MVQYSGIDRWLISIVAPVTLMNTRYVFATESIVTGLIFSAMTLRMAYLWVESIVPKSNFERGKQPAKLDSNLVIFECLVGFYWFGTKAI